MPKITVHGGPSIGGAQIVGGAWSDTTTPDEWPTPVEEHAEAVNLPAGSEVLADDETGALTASAGQGEPLPEAVEGDTAEQTSEPNYETWTVAQLREVLAERELPTSGTKAELIARLRTHDEP